MIRVYIIDDNRIVREIIAGQLSEDPRFEVVGASTATEAMRELPKVNPDVLTLDVEMPDIGGIEFLRWLMPKNPIPVIMLSSYTESGAKITLDSLEAGAIEFVPKADGSEEDFFRMILELKNKIRACARTDVNKLLRRKKLVITGFGFGDRKKVADIKLIALGASTGGTQALEFLLRNLPIGLPPIVIVQHMPPKFTTMFAARLNDISPLRIVEAENGMEISKNTVYIAPGDFHMGLDHHNTTFSLNVFKSEKVTGHRPSVNVLFRSIAASPLAEFSAAFLLTGMGKDGAEGMKAMRDRGSLTFGQDEATSVVYGMPREAFEIGAVQEQISLDSVPDKIAKLCLGEFENSI
ncbi:putative protein-glutamate methylesterase [Leptospira inadai serovar Lyme str. 10]|uniref:Protein-glutamate methylesterase/protein-glutamine glutaminase n=2 Tax=Leptospira inadai serovar Lyme TaxID=293084 RepID=V6HD79_9LEPT|nr:chemotaxis-specific protein-glutamate methyltransferase CheB [Leptospira inadai]EQA38016.1 putative protein-glutamate methylesterase [Leptospira inadai serovar Lyme str. 10]PNV74660.1 chemotaxis response regulator protein-glutamate methylesterase [Leptospira inadai serovar Lyme]